MLFHRQIELSLRYAWANFVHGCNYVFLCDYSGSLSVEYVEDSLELLIVQKWFHIHSCHQKVSIIDFLISKEIHLSNYFLNFWIWDVQIAILQSVLKIFSSNEACAFLINLSKCFLQVLNSNLVVHFYKHVHCGFFKLAYATKVPETFEHRFIDFRGLSYLLIFFKPRVFKSLICWKTLFWIYD